jgi:hypothetical protein
MKIELEEVQGILDSFIEEQKALQKQKAILQQQLRDLEVRFHRGAGGVLALNEILNRHGEFPHLKSGEKIIEEFDIPMTDSPKEMLEERGNPPAGISEKELARRREAVYNRQAMDWIGLLDRRTDEDDGPGTGIGTGGSPVGESGPAGEESLGGQSNEREPETDRPE